MIGRRIGHYRVDRKLGQGGMGAVFAAVHEQLGRRAAIKVLLPSFSAQPSMAARFLNEARAAHIVKHPGIVDTYEYGQLPDGTLFIVMELLEGEALSARLLRGGGGEKGALPQGLALRLARQLSSALAAAHRRGVVHRDLKPDNVIIVTDPDMPGGLRAKLLDFGLAKLTQELLPAHDPRTRSGIIMGTPRYMAPEQCRGVAGVTDRADVYSLGVLLYQMLCGVTPFDGEGVGDLLVAHIQQAPPSPRLLVAHLPVELEALVLEMLAKSPDRRPAMAEVARRLDALSGPQEDLPLVLPPVPRGAEALDPPAETLPEGTIASASLLESRVSEVFASPANPSGSAPSVAGEAAGSGARTPAAGESSLDVGPLTRDELALLARARPARAVLGVGLVLLVLVGGAALWRLRSGNAEGRDDGGKQALSELEGALREHRWEEALATAAQLQARSDTPAAARLLASEGLERARQEGAASRALQQMVARAAAHEPEQVLLLYGQVPRSSCYQAEARRLYERNIPLAIASRLERARLARAAGRCQEAQSLLNEVLTLAPAHAVALRLRERSCTGPGRATEAALEERAETLPPAPPASVAVIGLAPPPGVKEPAAALTPATPAAGARTEAVDARDPVPPAGAVAASAGGREATPAAASVPAAVSAARPAAEAVISSEDAARLLHAAQRQLTIGNYSEAIDTARPLTRLPSSRRVAWSMIGTAACRSRNAELAQQAYLQMDAEGAAFLRSVCAQRGLSWTAGRFRVGPIPAPAQPEIEDQ